MELTPAQSKKWLECSTALRLVENDCGFALLTPETQAAVTAARVPVGGWEVGLQRLLDSLNEAREPGEPKLIFDGHDIVAQVEDGGSK